MRRVCVVLLFLFSFEPSIRVPRYPREEGWVRFVAINSVTFQGPCACKGGLGVGREPKRHSGMRSTSGFDISATMGMFLALPCGLFEPTGKCS